MKVTMTGEGLAQSVKTLKPLDVFKHKGQTLLKVNQWHPAWAQAVNTKTGLIETVPLTAIVRKIGTMEIVAE